jgi:hypothetical protein
MDKFTVDQVKRPAHIDLTVTDRIGKNGNRLRERISASMVRGIIGDEGDVVRFLGPAHELTCRAVAFPDAEPGLVGSNSIWF